MRSITSLAAIAMLGWSLVHGVATVSARQVRSVPSARCATLGHPRFDIVNTRRFDTAASTKTVHTKEVDLTFDNILDIRGEGAGCVDGLSVNVLLMRDGDVYEIAPAMYLKGRDRNMSPFATTAVQAGPLLDGRRPVSVAAFSTSDYEHQRVGIWIGPGKRSSIALFDAGSGERTKPQVVGTTDVSLRGIRYFPAPDAPTGTVTVIHDITPDHIEVWVGELRDKPFVR